MEKQKSFVLMLSLKQIALRRVAVLLWTEPDILTSIGKFRELINRGDCQKKWRETVEREVSEKISKLQLPASLTERLIQIHKPIGLQILRWKTFHEAHLSPSTYSFSCEYFNVPILKKLRWTTAGTVDYRKTAEELVFSDVFDIVKRYKLACLYCLDHYIPELWKELPQENKMYFYDEKDISHIRQPLLQFCWPYILKGEEYKLDGAMPGRSSRDQSSFHQYMFTCFSFEGNKSAAEYFLQKLSLEERESLLVEAADSALWSHGMKVNISLSKFPKNNISDVVCYLLSLMTTDQRIQVFRKRPADVLGCFLYWPWQDAFLDFADSMWPWMRCEDLERQTKNYNTLLDKLRDSIRDSDNYLPNLYQNFFLRSPNDFRKHFVDRECEERRLNTFFTAFFRVQDAETMNLILRNVDTGDRLRLASSTPILVLFNNSISRGEVQLVERCLRGTGLSKRDKASLKAVFMGLLEERDGVPIESENPQWRRFFQFLDKTDVTAVQNKRSCDDEISNEPKKISLSN